MALGVSVIEEGLCRIHLAHFGENQTEHRALRVGVNC